MTFVGRKKTNEGPEREGGGRGRAGLQEHNIGLEYHDEQSLVVLSSILI